MPQLSSRFTLTATSVAASLIISACASTTPAAKPFDQTALPDAIKVPAGNSIALETVGVGTITYECRAKAGSGAESEWVFVGPDAKLNDRSGKQLGKYYGPPATWEHTDASKVTAVQLAVSPAGAGNIPLQLVKANASPGNGVFNGVSFIQRVATKGGVAPASPCTTQTRGAKEVVSYQADYIIWK